ncbi:MAG: hypothetical protein LBT98_02800 [Puniceicoccales bacterium]|jgi:hypothetical protein|nr:hypothetical protein [Puniceicoccales bacterium]
MEPDADERLGQLLRWKRWEQPDAAFWERFDATFQEKRLRSLAREGWGGWLLRLLRGPGRPALAAAGLLCAVTLLTLPPRPEGIAAAVPRETEFLLLTQEGPAGAVEEEIFDEGDDGFCYVSQAVPWTGAAVLSAYHF